MSAHRNDRPLFGADDMPVDLYVPTFDQWWERYPRKQRKKQARDCWARMTAAERASAWAVLPGWLTYWATIEPQYIPHGGTWLNQHRWEDDVPEPRRQHAPGSNAVRSVLSRHDR